MEYLKCSTKVAQLKVLHVILLCGVWAHMEGTTASAVVMASSVS